VTDQDNKHSVSVKNCPIKNMIADVLTKPLQGPLFRKFRRLILNLPDPVEDDILPQDTKEHTLWMDGFKADVKLRNGR
jgi:hypothetical protein